jgi:hypothetical protein
MIRVNDTDWPVLVLSVGPDSLDVAASQLPAFSRLCLPEPRVIAAIVHGQGLRAVASLERLVAWIRQFELVLTTNARGIAWTIEDDTLRSTVGALLRVQDHFVFGCPSHTFPTPRLAMQWLGTLLEPMAAAEVVPESRARQHRD